MFCVGNIANEKKLRKNNSIYFLPFYLFIGVSFSRWNVLLLLGFKTIKNSSGQVRHLYTYVAHESTLIINLTGTFLLVLLATFEVASE